MNIVFHSFLKIRLYAILITGLVLVVSACKKDKHEVKTPAGTRSELTADSLFLFAKDVYLWNSSLPTYNAFNPRQYVSSDMEAGLEKELFALTRYAINSSTGLPYEYAGSNTEGIKYSYIFNTNNANPVAYVPGTKSSVDLEGNGYDIGLQVGFYGDSKTNYKVYVQAVFPGSPAETAGMSRGDVISSINNKAVGSNFDADYSTLYNAFYTSDVTVTLKGIKRTGQAFNLTLTGSTYKSNPVYKDSVYLAGPKKVGYLAFARFSTETNSKAALADAFDKFATQGVTDLIIDLRYNRGGYVATAQYLMNLIIPRSKDGEVMLSEHYNDLMRSGKATILSKLPMKNEKGEIIYERGRIVTYADQDYSVAHNTYRFEKEGSLDNINSVVFIVTDNTASASELVINCLRPYMNVKIVGEQTYGKPVGFFPIRIDNYDVYLSSFESRNSRNEGEYYSGLAPDQAAVDNPLYLLGDLRETSLAAAYSYIRNGSFPATTASGVSSVSSGKLQLLNGAKAKLSSREFNGMIEDRIGKK